MCDVRLIKVGRSKGSNVGGLEQKRAGMRGVQHTLLQGQAHPGLVPLTARRFALKKMFSLKECRTRAYVWRPCRD